MFHSSFERFHIPSTAQNMTTRMETKDEENKIMSSIVFFSFAPNEIVKQL